MMCVLFCALTINAQKKVSILGDSYSTFEGYLPCDTFETWYYKVPPQDRTDVDKVTQTWWYQFIKYNNYRLCVDNSFSGATISYTGYNKADYSNRSFNTRMNNLGDCPDIIFIFGATNDSWANSPIGDYKYADWTRQDMYSFRPAMAHMMDYITTRYLNTDIYFIVNDGLKPEITESVHHICKYYKVPCIDMKDIDKKNGHPTIKGMQQIAKQLQNAIFKDDDNK